MSSTTNEPTPCKCIHSSACPRPYGSACEPVISGRGLPLKYAATGESVTSIPGAQLEARPAAARPASCAANAEKTGRSEEHTSELQSQSNLVCRLLLEKK